MFIYPFESLNRGNYHLQQLPLWFFLTEVNSILWKIDSPVQPIADTWNCWNGNFMHKCWEYDVIFRQINWSRCGKCVCWIHLNEYIYKILKILHWLNVISMQRICEMLCANGRFYYLVASYFISYAFTNNRFSSDEFFFISKIIIVQIVSSRYFVDLKLGLELWHYAKCMSLFTVFINTFSNNWLYISVTLLYQLRWE